MVSTGGPSAGMDRQGNVADLLKISRMLFPHGHPENGHRWAKHDNSTIENTKIPRRVFLETL